MEMEKVLDVTEKIKKHARVSFKAHLEPNPCIAWVTCWSIYLPHSRCITSLALVPHPHNPADPSSMSLYRPRQVSIILIVSSYKVISKTT